MIEYIVLMLFFLFLRKRFKLYIFKRNAKKYHKITEGAEPFFIKKGKTGVLCLHGFTSSAWDYREFGKYLSNKGYTVSAPLMAGHGTTPEHVSTTKGKDWLESVEKAFLDLKRKCNKIIVMGDSFGGNLALILAEKHDMDGVVVMGTPLFFKKQKFFTAIYYTIRSFKLFVKKRYHSILDPSIVKQRKTYNRLPLNCLREVGKLIKRSSRELGKVKAPILIMQSTTDFGISDKTPKYLYNHIGSEKKELVWIKNAYHVFIIDKNRKEYFKQIYDFIKNL